MIRLKLVDPQTYGLWDGDRLLARCRFSLEGSALLLEEIDCGEAPDGLDEVDALVRTTTNHMLKCGIDRVISRQQQLFERLEKLRFTRLGDCVESTPQEVLRHLCDPT